MASCRSPWAIRALKGISRHSKITGSRKGLVLLGYEHILEIAVVLKNSIIILKLRTVTDKRKRRCLDGRYKKGLGLDDEYSFRTVFLHKCR